MRYTVPFIALLAAMVSSGACASVRSDTSVAATRAPHALALDPAFADPAWKLGEIANNSFTNLTTRNNAPLKTAIYLLYDDSNLYVGFRCEQRGVPILASQTTNDIGFGLDDFVGVGLDTSANASQAYFFETTPRGIRYQAASETNRYKPDWQAAGSIAGANWSAVMIIPLKVMKIHTGARQAWRFNFFRSVTALGEHYTWAFDGIMGDAPVPQWPNFADARFWPTLSGLSIAPRGSLRPRPRAEIYALESVGRDRKLFAQSNGSFGYQDVRNLGIDLNYPLTRTISFVGTANPDFSNVEIDQQTIAPQEFRRSLNEYRPFFSQGANFINANPIALGVVAPPNLIFYSPGIGPFDRGAKVEGTFGLQSFGVLSVRGHDQITGNEFDDVAFGYKHALPDRTFIYFADGVLAHHSASGNDSTAEAGVVVRNLRTGFVGAASSAFENGSWLPAPGFARSSLGFLDVHKPNYEVNLGYQDITPNYNPIDGFTSNSDVRGPNGFLDFRGNGKAVKSYDLFFFADRYFDRSGAIHQADTVIQFNAAFKNQFSLNGGPAVGLLRRYDVLAGPNCGDTVVGSSYFTGYPCYRDGRSDRFNLFALNLGYRDGTPAPVDAGFAGGPFGDFYLHLYNFSTSRQIAKRITLGIEYDGTYERFFRGAAAGSVDSQFLRRISLGESLGPDSNFAISLRSISGTGGFAVPGLNLAASYRRKFATGNELFINYGTPASAATLDRLVVKYLIRLGGGSGT